MRSVLDFVKGGEFRPQLDVGALSAMPLWRFDREIEERGRESCAPRRKSALSSFLKSTCESTCPGNVLTDHIINREENAALLRMTLYGSLMRAYLYLSEKNSSASAVSPPGGCRVLPFHCMRALRSFSS